MDELNNLNIARGIIDGLVNQYNLNINENTISEFLENINDNPYYELTRNIINDLCPNMGDSTISVLFNNINARRNELDMQIAAEPLRDEDVNRLLRR